MRDINNNNVAKFFRENLHIEGEGLALITRAATVTAFFGDSLEHSQIVWFVGETEEKFNLELDMILRFVESHGFLENLEKEWAWERPMEPKQFIVMLAATLISRGLQYSSHEAEEEFNFARQELNRFFSPATIHRRRELRGYNIALEYIWQLLKGSHMPLEQFLSQQFRSPAPSGKSPEDDLRSFMCLVWENRVFTGAYKELTEKYELVSIPWYTEAIKMIADEITEKWNRLHADDFKC